MEHLNFIEILNYKTESGKTVSLMLSYQTFGRSMHDSPIVMVNHALTGNSNVTGNSGWWSPIVGSGKCIDTDYYSILSFNIPGNGFDGINEHLIFNYKDFTAKDIAKIFLIGLEKLNITSLFAIIGGSVGGGLAWELAALKPNLTKNLIPIASDWKATDWVIANCHIQESILNNSSKPLFDARLHAMTLYRTPESFLQKFQRGKVKNIFFDVEAWLNHHGNSLHERFQLSAYKLMNQILRTIDITNDTSSFIEVARQIVADIHIVSINSDLFFKKEENWNTYLELKKTKENVTIHEIHSIHGHDAFLIEHDQLSNLLDIIFSQKAMKLVI